MKRIILLFAILFTLSAQAQDTIKAKKDLSISIGAALNGGNNPFYGGNLKSDYSYKKGPWEIGLTPSFLINYASVGGAAELTKREFYNTASLTHVLTKDWKVIGFTEEENSYNKRIDLRYNGGLGIGYKMGNDKYEIGISEILIAEGLKMTDGSVTDYFAARASTRLKVKFVLKNVTISSVTMCQPAFYTNQDIAKSNLYILRSNNRIEFNWIKNTSIGFTYDANLNRYPTFLNSTVLPFDWGTTFFIMYKISK